MPLSNRRKAYFSMIGAVLLCTYAAILYARTTYSKANPFAAYLAYTTEDIYARARCYDDDASYIYHATGLRYCSIGVDVGFRINSGGVIGSISFARTALADVQVGDLYAMYGGAVSVNQTRHFTVWLWQTPTHRILAYSRHDNLYARVTFVLFTAR